MSDTRTQQAELSQLKRDVDALKRFSVTGGMSLTRGAGGQMIIGPGAVVETGFFARITGSSTSPYSFVEVVGEAVGSAAVTGGRTGTTNATEVLTGLAGIPSGTVVWMTAGGATAYRFAVIKTGTTGYMSAARLTGAVVAGAAGSFYARITGNSSKRYSFVQVAVNASDVVVDGAITGSTAVGYALDIGGGSTALHTPAPALVVLMTPNPFVAGTWLFGPIASCG